MRIYAGFVQTLVMRVPMNVKNTQRWVWIIAVSVQKLAGTAPRLVKKWLRQFKVLENSKYSDYVIWLN